MKKYLLIFASLFLVSMNLVAQEEVEDMEQEERGFDRSKMFIGGNFGLGFGTYNFNLSLSPQLGYRFNDLFAAGAGINFQYSSLKDYPIAGWKEKYTLAGVNVFGRIYPIRQIVLQVQPEINYSWGKIVDPGPPGQTYKSGKLVPSALVGAGGVLGGRGSGEMLIMAQYDLLQHERSPYGDKIFFSFGYFFNL